MPHPHFYTQFIHFPGSNTDGKIATQRTTLPVPNRVYLLSLIFARHNTKLNKIFNKPTQLNTQKSTYSYFIVKTVGWAGHSHATMLKPGIPISPVYTRTLPSPPPTAPMLC